MRFESARMRLDRAKASAADLETRIASFIKKHPPAPLIEEGPHRLDSTIKIKFAPLPKDWPVVVAEICEHLRHALDQAMFAASIAAGVANPSQAYFPFSDTPENLENVIRGRCTDVPKEV